MKIENIDFQHISNHNFLQEQQEKEMLYNQLKESTGDNNLKKKAYKLTKKNIFKIIILNISIITIILGISIYTIIFRIGLQRYQGSLQQHLPIHSGQIHYSRIPWQYWQHRILMIKAMGLNSLSVYVMWNHHQIAPGLFDFITQNKNLPFFLSLAKKHQMKVLFRPGPFVCAQWDFGGLPVRFINTYGINIRSNHPEYLKQIFIYFETLKPIFEPYLYKNGGPIIMIQLQNQMGYVSNDSMHTQNIMNMWKRLDIQTQFYIEDPGQFAYKNYLPRVHIGLSESKYVQRFMNIQISGILTDILIFGGQIYSGWFTSWGSQDWSTYDSHQFNSKIKDYIFHNRSVSLYMASGGTNFGLTAGANGLQPHEQYKPHVTSYDYDSPITEQGSITLKYQLLRKTFSNYYGQDHKLINIPQPIKTISIKDILMQKKSNIWGNLPQATIKQGELSYFQSDQLKMYNQGMVLYQTFLNDAKPYVFKIQARDYTMIFLDNKFIANTSRLYQKYYTIKVACSKAPCKLQILIQAMGHINYGPNIGLDNKGLINFQEINQQAQKNKYKWNIYKLQINQSLLNWIQCDNQYDFPSIYEVKIDLKEVGDTYFSLRQWGKGYIWVNGINLGRYWSIGPQFNVFCPGVWLKVGQNVIKILQLQNLSGDKPRRISSVQYLHQQEYTKQIKK